VVKLLRVRRALPVMIFFIAAALAVCVAVALAAEPAIKTFTPRSEKQVTNIDVLRQQLKNYYGAPLATTGPSGTWKDALDPNSNYADEAQLVAKFGTVWLLLGSHVKNRAIVLDVDDTTLTTWNYELFSNWDYNPTTNAIFVGLGNPPQTAATFTGNMFPATPGMVDMVNRAKALGYAIFFITGRGDSQHAATIANLVNDTAAGFSDITSVTYSGVSPWAVNVPVTVPEIDAGYPMPTAVDTGHGGFSDGLFTKPPVGQYPAYLDTPEFCGPYIHATPPASCPTLLFKSGTRAYITKTLGYDIVANFGDQFSDLDGGYADKTFKMPNPNYFLP
jgi:hypothetical protein